MQEPAKIRAAIQTTHPPAASDPPSPFSHSLSLKCRLTHLQRLNPGPAETKSWLGFFCRSPTPWLAFSSKHSHCGKILHQKPYLRLGSSPCLTDCASPRQLYLCKHTPFTSNTPSPAPDTNTVLLGLLQMPLCPPRVNNYRVLRYPATSTGKQTTHKGTGRACETLFRVSFGEGGKER